MAQKKKLFFYTCFEFGNAASNGICKKILAQMKVFANNGYDVDYTCTINGDVYVVSGGKRICIGKASKISSKLKQSRKLIGYLKDKKYDCAYIRYGLSDPWLITVLQDMKKKGARILMELPTYPYEGELSHTGLKGDFVAALDRKYRKKLKTAVDKIVTFSEDEEIFGIKTIRTCNGVDFDVVKKVEKTAHAADEIHLIAVAGLAKWHGYDRMISGIGKYYQNQGKRNIIFHVVGEGKELEKYRRISGEYHIEKHVILHGFQSGDALDAIYNRSDIGVSSLGLHRIGLKAASTLKSREYGAKGLPLITTCRLDFYPEDWKYQLVVPQDDSSIEMQDVIRFYDQIQAAGEDLAEIIRRETMKTASMEATFADILAFYAKA